MKQLCMLIAIAALPGCGTLADRAHRREVSDARADDAYCVQRDLHYPDADYVVCRRNLQDGRLYQIWQNERMMETNNGPWNPATAKPANTIMDEFHPLDADRFRCEIDSDYGGDFVACHETQAPPNG